MGTAIKIYDVTLPIHPGMVVWPGDAGARLTPTSRMADGDDLNLSKLALGVHTGTHVDAPYHFVADGATVEQLPLGVLIARRGLSNPRPGRRIWRSGGSGMENSVCVWYKT